MLCLDYQNERKLPKGSWSHLPKASYPIAGSLILTKIKINFKSIKIKMIEIISARFQKKSQQGWEERPPLRTKAPL